MAERTFSIFNAPQYGYNSTTAPAKVATGATRRTMLQIQASPLGPPVRIIEWGVGFDSSSLVAPGLIELVETGNVGASGTNWVGAKMPYSTLGTAISSGATTTFALASGGGVLFVPQYGGTSQTMLNAPAIVAPIATAGGVSGVLSGASEMVLITARATDSLTVTRNIDGRGALASIPVGSPLLALDGQLQQDIVGDNSGQMYPPSSVIWQNCGWNNGGGAASTDLGGVLVNRFLAPPQLLEPIGGPLIQLPLGREPQVEPGNFARVVMTFPSTVNATCWIKWAE
jgi:hypothetical protein